MHPDKLLRDRKTDARALVEHRRGGGMLEKSFEDLFLLVLRDTDTRVFHLYGDPFPRRIVTPFHLPQQQCDRSTPQCELERIRQQVEKDALHLIPIEQHI